ncbi:MAG: DUF1330 domain-containing protein [Alphaproteobacteria bacterium]|nr:MAG: DUF1330 domain-containing protein [Alphaproteobacteria bacterium]
MTDDMPGLLVVKAFCPHARHADFCARAAAPLAAASGTLVLAQPVHDVAALEPGSVPAHLWVAAFAHAAARDAAWAALAPLVAASGLDQAAPPVILAMAGIGAAGLGDAIPTAANVTPPASGAPPAYFLVEGTASDPPRMDRYRDILLDMMRRRGAYYVAFELGGNVRVLSGAWAQAIFAISRWPSRRAAIDCWTDRRYQDQAIPLRLGIGRFSVLMAEGAAL